MANMGVCTLSPLSAIKFTVAVENSLQVARRELSFGHKRGRRRSRMHAWACKAEEEDDDDRNEVLRTPLDLRGEFSKAFESDESKALLKDLAEASKRVSAKKRELDELNRREQKAVELQTFLQRLENDQEIADSAVSEIEDEVLKAEAEVRTAELALVMARAGSSASEISGKWEASDIDEDAERIESGKAAAVSAIAGTFVSLPFTVAIDGGLSLGALLIEAGILVSCALFGVTYRYALRRDLANWHLKSGVAAAFGVVRGAGYATQALGGFPETGVDSVLKGSLIIGESVLIFLTAAVALDYCLRENVLSPFPLKKQP